MKYEVDIVKGFQDFLPPDSIKRDAIKKVISKWFKLYGFVPVETPVIEFDETMRTDALPSETEDEAVSERFRLQDRGGRKLGLRYEFTFQLARIFKQNPNIKLPFKRYQIGEVFRDEPVTQKRFKQFTQCDVDIVGDYETKADAECLALFSDILKELNIDCEIQVNNRRLLEAIIESVELKNSRNVMKELDKMEKLGEDEVKTNLRKYGSINQIITLFKLLEKNMEFFKENSFDGVDELQSLIDECKLQGVQIKINPFLARGLSYYTGNIFEVKSQDKYSIAAGGRYDKTVGKYLNKNIPAVGISFGLERLTDLAKITPKIIPQVLIVSINQNAEAIKLAKKLRKEKISCSIERSKPSSSLDYANSLAIPYAIFVGKDEIESKKFKLKDMSSGIEESLNEKQLLKKLKEKD